MSKYYTGIGSRNIPDHYVQLIATTGSYMAQNGFILRSGGAIGSDSAFEFGCDKMNGKKEIYLPWKNFMVKEGRVPSNSDIILDKETDTYLEAFNIFKELVDEYKDYNLNGPEWMHSLMIRNMHQILGKDLKSPSDLVIFYTKNSEEIGGTRWALRLAKKHNIPVHSIVDFIK